MLCADDAGIVSKSAEGLAKLMNVLVTAFEAAGLTVSNPVRWHGVALSTPFTTALRCTAV